MLFNNFRKIKNTDDNKYTINIDIHISLRNALSDKYIRNIIEKIKYETAEIPHVNINFNVT